MIECVTVLPVSSYESPPVPHYSMLLYFNGQLPETWYRKLVIIVAGGNSPMQHVATQMEIRRVDNFFTCVRPPGQHACIIEFGFHHVHFLHHGGEL